MYGLMNKRALMDCHLAHCKAHLILGWIRHPKEAIGILAPRQAATTSYSGHPTTRMNGGSKTVTELQYLGCLYQISW